MIKVTPSKVIHLRFLIQGYVKYTLTLIDQVIFNFYACGGSYKLSHIP